MSIVNPAEPNLTTATRELNDTIKALASLRASTKKGADDDDESKAMRAICNRWFEKGMTPHRLFVAPAAVSPQPTARGMLQCLDRDQYQHALREAHTMVVEKEKEKASKGKRKRSLTAEKEQTRQIAQVLLANPDMLANVLSIAAKQAKKQK